MSNMRQLKKGVAQGRQQNAAASMPPMQSPVDQEMPQEGQQGQLSNMANPEQQQDATPEQKKFAEGMNSLVMNFIYRDEVKNSVAEMITSGQPEKTIPMTAQQVFTKLDMMLRENGKPLDLEGKALASMMIFSETVEIGQALGALPQEIPEDKLEKMLTKTLQDKIHEGLKDGSIDPIELQEKIEPYLDDDMKQMGMQYAGQAGISSEVNSDMVHNKEKADMQRAFSAEKQGLQKQLREQQTALKGFQQAIPEGK